MHWGNFARFASFFKMGTITSSTRAQKCSRELGWMSPQVMWFRSFCPASGRGSASRLTKNTPLFLYFIVVCICRYKITIIWSIFGVQLRKSRGYIWWLYTFSNDHTTHLRGLGQSVCIWSCPPIFWEMIKTWGRSKVKRSQVFTLYQ